MQIEIPTSDPAIRKILQASFPDFKGKSVTVQTCEAVEFYGTLWDSGNKRSYVAVHLYDMRGVTIPDAPYAQRSARHENPQPLAAGIVVVCHVHAGLREYVQIYCRPDETIARIESDEDDISQDEKIVLYATRSLKSSYAGISNYRFHEARQATGIDSARWEFARQSLIAKKMLNKRGAITIDGRNRIQGVYTWSSLTAPQQEPNHAV